MTRATRPWDPLRRLREPYVSASAKSVVYFIRCREFVKIGMTNDVKLRLTELQVGNPYPLEVLGTIPGGRLEEGNYHAIFCESRSRGEWFRITSELVEGLRTLDIHVETDDV